MVGRLRKSVRFGLFAQLLLVMLLTYNGCLPGGCVPSGHTGQEDRAYTSARQTMVTQQIKKRGIRDERVLHALTQVPRHLFVPPAYRDRAYQDEPLSIGQGQTISQPYIVALMSERLLLTGTEKVLEIGTGSGYQAAVLSHLAQQVYSIEILPQRRRKAGGLRPCGSGRACQRVDRRQRAAGQRSPRRDTQSRRRPVAYSAGQSRCACCRWARLPSARRRQWQATRRCSPPAPFAR